MAYYAPLVLGSRICQVLDIEMAALYTSMPHVSILGRLPASAPTTFSPAPAGGIGKRNGRVGVTGQERYIVRVVASELLDRINGCTECIVQSASSLANNSQDIINIYSTNLSKEREAASSKR